jgi:hypothetical protein
MGIGTIKAMNRASDNRQAVSYSSAQEFIIMMESHYLSQPTQRRVMCLPRTLHVFAVSGVRAGRGTRRYLGHHPALEHVSADLACGMRHTRT